MDHDGRKRVVVTGIGPVTSVGIGNDAFHAGLQAETHPVRPLPESYRRFYTPHTGFYVPLPAVTPEAFGLSAKYNRIMQHESRFAVVAAKLALEDAKIPLTASGNAFTVPDGDQACVIIGIGIGGLENSFNSYTAHTASALSGNSGTPQVRFNRMVVPMLMPNAAAAWVTIFFGITGGSCTVNASCASGTAAIGQAYLRVAQGMNRWALCGGVEALTENSGSILRGFDMLGVLTRAPDGIPQPFSNKRSGMLFAEGGGCILVIEELSHALERHAPVYAEITDYAETGDGYNIIQIDPEGHGIQRLLKRLTQDNTIDFLNTHGTGTILNDATEADAIRTVFGNKNQQPLLGTTKGLIGHTLGASGAIEAADCLLALHHQHVCRNRCEEPLPELNLPLEHRQADIGCAASVSYGFGGHNCGIVFRKFDTKQ